MTSITRRWFISYHDFPISLYLNGLQFPLISYFGNERSLYRKRSFPALELSFPYKGMPVSQAGNWRLTYMIGLT